jgi:uncharacterized MAPEG superfamily protein
MPPLLHVVLPIVLAMAIPFLSTLIAKAGTFTAADNKETRQWQAHLTGWRQRAYWAHLNALETFPVFAVAVVVAHLGAPGSTVAVIAAYAYPAIRMLYLGAFLADQGALRSVIWFVSMADVLVLFAAALGLAA